MEHAAACLDLTFSAVWPLGPFANRGFGALTVYCLRIRKVTDLPGVFDVSGIYITCSFAKAGAASWRSYTLLSDSAPIWIFDEQSSSL